MVIVRNCATNTFPLLLATYMKVNGASTRLLSSFSALGISVSARTVDRFRVRMSDEAIRLARAFIRETAPRFRTVADNLNLFLKKLHQQRLDNPNSMIHCTNVAILGFPSSVKPEGFDLTSRLNLRGTRAGLSAPDTLVPSTAEYIHTTAEFEAMVIKLFIEHSPSKLKHRSTMKMQADNMC